MLILSFNSYKGGACRTTTCYNTLPYLADKLGATSHQPILVFDVDLDSMGLTSLLCGKIALGEPMRYSAKHLFIEDDYGVNASIRDGFDQVEQDNYFDNYRKIGNFLGLEDDGSVLFCPADPNADTISDRQFQAYASNPPLRTLLHALKDMAKEDQPKAVIFDCASGVQQTTLGVLSSIDCGVMCMRPTTQFRIGTRDYLLNKIPKRLRSFRTEHKRRIILLPTSVSPMNIPESDPNYLEARKKLVRFRDDAFKSIEYDIIGDIQDEIGRGSALGYVLDDSMIRGEGDDDVYGIPEIERFKWTEAELLYKIDDTLTEQEKRLKARYQLLAETICKE